MVAPASSCPRALTVPRLRTAAIAGQGQKKRRPKRDEPPGAVEERAQNPAAKPPCPRQATTGWALVAG